MLPSHALTWELYLHNWIVWDMLIVFWLWFRFSHAICRAGWGITVGLGGCVCGWSVGWGYRWSLSILGYAYLVILCMLILWRWTNCTHVTMVPIYSYLHYYYYYHYHYHYYYYYYYYYHYHYYYHYYYYYYYYYYDSYDHNMDIAAIRTGHIQQQSW